MRDNIYYEPDKFGLEIVDEIDDVISCYSFDLTVVWRDKETEHKYWYYDSGCSCPVPFEDVKGVAELFDLESDEDWNDMNNHLMSVGREHYPLKDINQFISRVLTVTKQRGK